jgi:Trypsin-like peptidase domain
VRPELVVSEAYERVLEIETALGSGTAFTISEGGAQYLVTAKHLLPEGDLHPTVKLSNRFIAEQLGGPVEHRCELLPITPDRADVAVAPLPSPLTPDLTLEARTDGLVFSQTVWFLGFPYGLAMEMDRAGGRLAFVKRGIISAAAWVEDVHVLYLDGLNNPGFSGGPVVGYHQQSQTMCVFGVVSGYRFEHQPVFVGTQEVGTAQANTGIVIATWVDHVTDAIRAARNA